MSDLDEMKSYIRDINLDILMNSPEVKIDISKRYYNRFRFFYPNRKLIKCLNDIGGVLVGSRAVRCFTINGKSMLDRKVNDWDFVVTTDMAFKICDDMGIEEIPKIGSVISIKNQRYWVNPSYSDPYRVGAVDVQIIVKEELPTYTEIDGVRISNFGYTISQKLELASELENKLNTYTYEPESIKTEYEKHISDLKEIIIKFNSLKWVK